MTLTIVVVMKTSTFFWMLKVPGIPKRVPILHGEKPRFPEANSWKSQDLGNRSDYPCSMLLFAWSTHSTESSANPRGRLHCHLQLTQSKVRHGVWLAQGHTEAGTSAAKASRPILPVRLGFRFQFVDLVWIYLLSKRKCFEQKLPLRWDPWIPGCPDIG